MLSFKSGVGNTWPTVALKEPLPQPPPILLMGLFFGPAVVAEALLAIPPLRGAISGPATAAVAFGPRGPVFGPAAAAEAQPWQGSAGAGLVRPPSNPGTIKLAPGSKRLPAPDLNPLDGKAFIAACEDIC